MRSVRRMGQRLHHCRVCVVAGMIAPDIRAALDVMACIAVQASHASTVDAVQYHLSRLGHSLQALIEAVERVEQMEESPVPLWWRGQPSDPAEWPENVVAIRGKR